MHISEFGGIVGISFAMSIFILGVPILEFCLCRKLFVFVYVMELEKCGQ